MGPDRGPGRTLREHRGHLKAFVLQGRKRRKSLGGLGMEAGQKPLKLMYREERNIRTRGDR